jgi:hypothetical protein
LLTAVGAEMMVRGRNYNVKIATAMRHSAPEPAARKGRALTVAMGDAVRNVLLVYKTNRRHARMRLS